MDLARPGYQNIGQIISTGKRYVENLDDFAKYKDVVYTGVRIRRQDVKARVLEIFIPPWSTPAQKKALNELVAFGAAKNPAIVVKILEIK
jgi:hypothetical protein